MTPYQKRQLDQAPARVTRFMSAITAVPAIGRPLAQIGLNDAEMAEGRRLLMAALGDLPAQRLQGTDAISAAAARVALNELDQSDEALVTRVRAALTHHHPALATLVLQDLKAGTGIAAVKAVTTLVARIRALPDEGEEGRAARALLARRGFTDAELDRLDGLVKTALGDASLDAAQLEAAATEAELAEQAQAEAARQAVLVDLDAWWRDWSQSARAVIRRRDHLIRLGLLKRRRKRPDDDDDDDEPSNGF